MEVIYFEKYVKSNFHSSEDSSTCHFYIPEENVVLSMLESGIMGTNVTYSIKDDETTLKVACEIAQGNIPDFPPGIKYDHVRKFEYDSSKLKDLIGKTRQKRKLEEEIPLMFVELLNLTK